MTATAYEPFLTDSTADAVIKLKAERIGEASNHAVTRKQLTIPQVFVSRLPSPTCFNESTA